MRTSSRLRALNILSGLVLPCFLVACNPQVEASRQDPKGLIQYELPASWVEVPSSGGTRFRPSNGEIKGVQLQVSTIEKVIAPEKIEREREMWRKFQEKNGAEILTFKDWESNGFKVFEISHTQQQAMGDGVLHQAYMVNGDFRVAASLSATADLYETHRPQFEKTVNSIEPIAR